MCLINAGTASDCYEAKSSCATQTLCATFGRSPSQEAVQPYAGGTLAGSRIAEAIARLQLLLQEEQARELDNLRTASAELHDHNIHIAEEVIRIGEHLGQSTVNSTLSNQQTGLVPAADSDDGHNGWQCPPSVVHAATCTQMPLGPAVLQAANSNMHTDAVQSTLGVSDVHCGAIPQSQGRMGLQDLRPDSSAEEERSQQQSSRGRSASRRRAAQLPRAAQHARDLTDFPCSPQVQI